jgi:outer membrane protein assembly factor BamB
VAVIGPAHRGVIARALADPPAVQQLDPTGNVVWSHPLRADNPPEINGSLPSADGGVIVFGTLFGDLDLGELTIHFTPGDVSDGFIVSFDATGATRWGYAVPDAGVARLTAIGATKPGNAAGEDRFVATGQRQVGGSQLAPDIDSYLILATTAGVTRQLAIGGPGIQDLLAMAAAPDGAVWAQVLNVASTDDRPEPAPVVEIGEHRFTDSGVYLFKIVP